MNRSVWAEMRRGGEGDRETSGRHDANVSNTTVMKDLPQEGVSKVIGGEEVALSASDHPSQSSPPTVTTSSSGTLITFHAFSIAIRS